MGNRADKRKARREREEVPAAEARARLAELIDRCGFGGEQVVLTRNNKPLVAIIGMQDLQRLDGVAA